MGKPTVLSAILMILLGTAESLICHDCYHHKYTSPDSTLDEWLHSISDYDDNCLSEGDHYVEVDRTSCYRTCFKETGTAVLRYGTKTVNFEVAQRGCSPNDREAETCRQLTVSSTVADYEMMVESEDVYGCYCDTDYCNHGNFVKLSGPASFLMLVATLTLPFA